MASHTVGGGKICGNHSTTTDISRFVAKEANKLAEVKRILLGFITITKKASSEPRLSFKLTENGSGLRVNVRQARSIQELLITTSNPEKVQADLQAAFDHKYGGKTSKRNKKML